MSFKDLTQIIFWIVGSIAGIVTILDMLGMLEMPPWLAKVLRWSVVVLISLAIIWAIILGRANLKVIVICEIWELPQSVENDLKNIDNLRGNLEEIGDANDIRDLHDSITGKSIGTICCNVGYDSNYITDTKGMYYIVLQNERWGKRAKAVTIAISDANYICVEDSNGVRNEYRDRNGPISLGDLDPSRDVHIKAWTISKGGRESAKKIEVVSDAGLASPYVKEPAGRFAELVNRFTIPILLAMGAIVIFHILIIVARRRKKVQQIDDKPEH